MSTKPKKETQAVLVAGICAIVFITVVTIVAELNPGFKDLLAIYLYHHWLAKAVLSSVCFAAAYLFFNNTNIIAKHEDEVYLVDYLSFISLLGVIIIFGFFLFHALVQ